jgi:hypothetical protein
MAIEIAVRRNCVAILSRANDVVLEIVLKAWCEVCRDERVQGGVVRLALQLMFAKITSRRGGSKVPYSSAWLRTCVPWSAYSMIVT